MCWADSFFTLFFIESFDLMMNKSHPEKKGSDSLRDFFPNT